MGIRLVTFSDPYIIAFSLSLSLCLQNSPVSLCTGFAFKDSGGCQIHGRHGPEEDQGGVAAGSKNDRNKNSEESDEEAPTYGLNRALSTPQTRL